MEMKNRPYVKRCLKEFFKGFVSPFDGFFEPYNPPKICNENGKVLYKQYDANQAFHSDWEAIGADMWKAIKQVEKEIESDNACAK